MATDLYMRYSLDFKIAREIVNHVFKCSCFKHMSRCHWLNLIAPLLKFTKQYGSVMNTLGEYVRSYNELLYKVVKMS